MIGVNVTVDLTSVQRGLEALYRKGRDTRPVLASLRNPARKDQVAHGRAQRGPDAPWVPRAAATTQGRSKRAKKARRRRLLGRLSSAVVTSVSRGGLTLQSQIEWSGIHQYGGTAGRGARIPARPFLWWSQEILDEVARRLLDHLAEAW